MGHVQPSAASEFDDNRKRSLEAREEEGDGAAIVIAPANKRPRAAEVWYGQHETPPPSPTDSSSEASEDETDEEEEEEGDRAAYQGSILASCLLSDKRSGSAVTAAAYGAEPEPAGYSPACELGRAPASVAVGSGFSGWYGDGGSFQRLPQNQTVECDGKSYIQLGAVAPQRERSQFYRYQRFTVLHATMVKLSRHRRMMDPVLRKSVLLFNTMRHIERELEQEGLSLAAAFNPHHFESGPLTLDPPPPPQTPTPPPAAAAPCSSTGVISSPCTDSGFGDDEINWGSVLSLSSQPELELMSGDGGATSLSSDPGWQLTPLSADDVLRTFPADRRDDSDGGGGCLTSLLAL